MKMFFIVSKINTPLLLAATVAVLGPINSAQAQYATPPSWMPMTMLNISYDSGLGKLAVVDQSTVYTLFTSTLASGMPDTSATTYANYDPGQPWAVIQNHAFSRRLGWYSPTAATLQSDIESTYGAGASIWIELISQTAGLETYLAVGKYGVNADNTTTVDPLANGYLGIFGTAGSATKWQWDYLMDHNVYAVDQAYLTTPNQPFSATYKVYVGDAGGNEILNLDLSSTSTLETWSWQGPAVVPEPTTLGLAAAGMLGLLAFRRIKP